MPAGGTLNPTNYSFGPNQGLALSNGLADAGSYSIETVFRFSEINGYRKIIDFKDRTVDAGLYNRTGELRFHSIQSGPSGAFAPNVVAHLVVTRDATTDGFVAYVNGVRQIAFMDTGDNVVFSAPNNIIHFFKDDFGSEASTGVVDRIVVYDEALTAAEAADLFAPPVPRPLSMSMTLTEATLTPWAGPAGPGGRNTQCHALLLRAGSGIDAKRRAARSRLLLHRGRVPVRRDQRLGQDY